MIVVLRSRAVDYTNDRAIYNSMLKGDRTRQTILERAVAMAAVTGIEGVSIGGLARDVGLSKSGLFAHFGSKERLQIGILEATVERFVAEVIRPARRVSAGLPRLRALFANWLIWAAQADARGGCIFVSSAVEYDDRPGPVRDYLAWSQRSWLEILARAVERAVEVGHFRPGVDAEQFAHDLYAIELGFHHARRLLHDPKAETRARYAFDALVDRARAPS